MAHDGDCKSSQELPMNAAFASDMPNKEESGICWRAHSSEARHEHGVACERRERYCRLTGGHRREEFRNRNSAQREVYGGFKGNKPYFDDVTRIRRRGEAMIINDLIGDNERRAVRQAEVFSAAADFFCEYDEGGDRIFRADVSTLGQRAEGNARRGDRGG